MDLFLLIRPYILFHKLNQVINFHDKIEIYVIYVIQTSHIVCNFNKHDLSFKLIFIISTSTFLKKIIFKQKLHKLKL